MTSNTMTPNRRDRIMMVINAFSPFVLSFFAAIVNNDIGFVVTLKLMLILWLFYWGIRFINNDLPKFKHTDDINYLNKTKLGKFDMFYGLGILIFYIMMSIMVG